MIRLLTHEDRDIVRSYLDRDPLHNVYLIHGLQTHGLECEYVTFWGAFDKGQLVGVLFADNDSKPRFGCLASDDPSVLARLGKFALASKVNTLVGKNTYVQPAIGNLHSRVHILMKHCHFWEMHPERFVPCYDYPVRAATEEDIPSLIELYRDYEFRSPHRTEEDIAHEIRRAMAEAGRCFLIELEGRIVSAALVTQETDRAGMVGVARTLPEFRGRGMYPAVRTACCEYLFKQGKIGLTYILDTNASMMKIAEKQGGLITAEWLIAHVKDKPPLGRRILPPRLRRWGARIRAIVLPRRS